MMGWGLHPDKRDSSVESEWWQSIWGRPRAIFGVEWMFPAPSCTSGDHFYSSRDHYRPIHPGICSFVEMFFEGLSVNLDLLPPCFLVARLPDGLSDICPYLWSTNCTHDFRLFSPVITVGWTRVARPRGQVLLKVTCLKGSNWPNSPPLLPLCPAASLPQSKFSPYQPAPPPARCRHRPTNTGARLAAPPAASVCPCHVTGAMWPVEWLADNECGRGVIWTKY